MSNPFETTPARAPNPFESGRARRASDESQDGFSNPFEGASTTTEGAGRGAGGFGETLPEVPMPESAYERAVGSGGAPHSTFGAYDVAAGAGATGGGVEAAAEGGRSAFRSATSAFKGAFGGGSSSASAVGGTQGAMGTSAGGGGASAASLTAARRDLERREAEILRRERDLEVRERSARSGGGGKTPNWPFSFWAFTYHNISDEIHPHHRSCVRFCYTVYCVFALALVSNFFVAMARMFLHMDFAAFLMAFIYMVCGIPGAYMLWYRRVYNSCKTDRAFGFLWFFLMFMVHIGFVFFATLAPPNMFGAQKWSLCGILNLNEALQGNKAIGVMHTIVMLLFAADSVLSVLAIRWVYSSFRSGGHTLEQARAEAYREGIAAATTGGIGSAAV